MSLVQENHMTDLRTASESLQTALTSPDEIQLEAVAYAINTAANTGSTRVIFQEKLRENTITQLESKGYTITYVKAANIEGQALISWNS